MCNPFIKESSSLLLSLKLFHVFQQTFSQLLMFWRFGFQAAPLEALLSQENVTLGQVLQEEDLLQECKSRNAKLIPLQVS